jgi:hypothetical protein
MDFLFTLRVVTPLFVKKTKQNKQKKQNNLISANRNPGVVGAKLAKEIVACSIVAPFSRS